MRPGIGIDSPRPAHHCGWRHWAGSPVHREPPSAAGCMRCSGRPCCRVTSPPGRLGRPPASWPAPSASHAARCWWHWSSWPPRDIGKPGRDPARALHRTCMARRSSRLAAPEPSPCLGARRVGDTAFCGGRPGLRRRLVAAAGRSPEAALVLDSFGHDGLRRALCSYLYLYVDTFSQVLAPAAHWPLPRVAGGHRPRVWALCAGGAGALYRREPLGAPCVALAPPVPGAP